MSPRINKNSGVTHAISSAMKDKRLTQAEAKHIHQVAMQGGISGAERKAVQQMVDHWGDRFSKGADKALGSLAQKNSVDALRDQFDKSHDQGSVNLQDMQQIIKGVKKGGVTAAERREMVRQAGLNQGQFTAQAQQLNDTFRATADSNTKNVFDQRLPTGPGQDGNRLVNPKTGKTGFSINQDLFKSKDGVRMVDGEGKDRGRLIESPVKINYGQRKTINGEPHVYAFATHIKTPQGDRSASGWIPEKALKDGPIQNMPSIEAPKPIGGDLKGGTFTITGGDPKKFGDLKVAPHISRKERVAAGDYMRRPGGVVNMLYNLPGKGGVSTDTFKTGATFIRSAGVKPVQVQLYKPESSEQAGKMTFVYGRVGDRYGWIAQDSLAKK